MQLYVFTSNPYKIIPVPKRQNEQKKKQQQQKALMFDANNISSRSYMFHLRLAFSLVLKRLQRNM